jgi:hypothetical protein
MLSCLHNFHFFHLLFHCSLTDLWFWSILNPVTFLECGLLSAPVRCWYAGEAYRGRCGLELSNGSCGSWAASCWPAVASIELMGWPAAVASWIVLANLWPAGRAGFWTTNGLPARTFWDLVVEKNKIERGNFYGTKSANLVYTTVFVQKNICTKYGNVYLSKSVLRILTNFVRIRIWIRLMKTSGSGSWPK